MPLKFFAVPVLSEASSAEDLNAFLGSHRVVSVDRELVHDGASSFWAVCVTYLNGSPADVPGARKRGVDYREILCEEDFAVFAKLRTLRKELAEKDGVPAYALFTNEQLAAMVTQRVTSKSGLKEISGIGPSRVEKYGAPFLSLLENATRGQVDGS